jgi:hypothetical protein
LVEQFNNTIFFHFWNLCSSIAPHKFGAIESSHFWMSGVFLWLFSLVALQMYCSLQMTSHGK